MKLQLDAEGFNARTLHTAWKSAKNEDIAADIIAYIRTLALDVDLIPQEQRIANAFAKVNALRTWNKIQQRWLDRFKAQLMAEAVLTKDDLNNDPFKEEGGYNRINKIFDDNVDEIIQILNDNLYSEGA